MSIKLKRPNNTLQDQSELTPFQIAKSKEKKGSISFLIALALKKSGLAEHDEDEQLEWKAGVKRGLEEYNRLVSKNETKRRHRLLEAFALILFVSFSPAPFIGFFLMFVNPPLAGLLFLYALSQLFGLMAFFLSFRLSKMNHYSLASWLLQLGFFIAYAFSCWLYGSTLPSAMGFLLALAIAVTLMRSFEVLLLSLLSLAISTTLLVGENTFHFYTPPMPLTPPLSTIITLLFISFLIPAMVATQLIPTRMRARILKGQNRQLQQEIRERIRAEEQLRESETRFRKLAEILSAAIFIRQGAKLSYVNPAFQRITGYSEQELLNKEFWELAHPTYQVSIKERGLARLRGEAVPSQYEFKLLTKQGEERWVFLSMSTIELEGTVANLGTFVDITERKKAEEALEAEKEQLAVTLQSIGDGVITTDITGKVVLLNTVAEQLTGFTQAEASNRLLSDVFQMVNEDTGEKVETPVQKVLANSQIVTMANHTWLIRRDGSRIIIATSAAPICNNVTGQLLGVVFVFRDMTEKQKMEQELLKIQKLESLGVLAGGIAHDFNNILTVVIGNISLAKLVAEGANPEKIKELPFLLDQAETAVIQTKGLTQQLLTFAKGGVPLKRVAFLSTLLEESARFVLHGSKVSGQFELASDLWPVEIDEGQIGQVIHNLVLNAVQAMPRGGTITIKAENMTNYAGESGLPLSEQNYVKISVNDEGIGIAPETLPKIFDPYFTTKPKGNGLGLASCFSIISKHEGYLTVQSQLGVGTTFFIYLPAAAESAATSAQHKRVENKENMGGGQNRRPWRILALDDEVAILYLLKKTLGQNGYLVDGASDATEMLELYQKALLSAEPYDLVILDLTIPGSMGGQELLQHLRTLNADVQALVISGYANDPVMAHYQQYGFAGALSKPFNASELLGQVEELLN
jgi:PAS domain S-box-containing protein